MTEPNYPGYQVPGYPAPQYPATAYPPVAPPPNGYPTTAYPPVWPPPNAFQPAAYPPAGPPRPRSGGRGKTGLLIAAIAVVVALIVAGLVFGVPGTGFHGLAKPDSTPATGPSGSPGPTAPGKTGQPSQASYSEGFKQTWQVTPGSVGLGAGGTLWLTTVTDSTWVIQASDNEANPPMYSLLGVDAVTGAKKWQTTPSATWTNCASQAIDNIVYCADSGRIYSVDPETGRVSDVVEVFRAGTIQTVGGAITLDATAGSINIEALGGYLVAFDSDYSTQSDFTLISLLKPSGQILWTDAAPIFASCGASPPPDVLTDGIIVFNSLCQSGIFDVATGKLLAHAAGFTGVAGRGLLWTMGGAADVATFTSSDGTNWAIYSMKSDGGVGVTPITSAQTAPLAVTSGGVAWIKPDGSPLWTANLHGQGLSSSFDGTNLIVTDDNGAIWALSPKDGTILWSTQVPGSVSEGWPDTFVLPDGTAMTQWDDALDAYSASSGRLYWSTTDFWINTWVRLPGSMTLAGVSIDLGAIYRIDPASPSPTPGQRSS